MPARADLEIAEGNIRSPLHGVPIAYKDLLATNAIKTTSGTSVYADHVPDYDATVVSRLAAAGTVMLGKLKLTEGAFSRHHPTVEIPQNPWGREPVDGRVIFRIWCCNRCGTLFRQPRH